MIRRSAMLVSVCAGCVFGVSMPGLAQTLTRPASTPQKLDPNKPRERRKSDLPTGAQVHEKFIEVTGGRAAFLKHRHCHMKARLEVPKAEASIALDLYQEEGQRFSQRVELPDKSTVVLASDGKLVWEVRSTGEISLLPPPEAKAMILSNDFRHELNLIESYTLLECVGIEPVDSRPAYKVLLVAPDGTATTRFYDQESGLLVKKLSKSIVEDKSVEVVTTLADYRDVEGVKIPFTISTISEGVTRHIKMESIDFTRAINQSLFEIPAPIKQALDADSAEREGAKQLPAAPSLPVAPPKQGQPPLAPPPASPKP